MAIAKKISAPTTSQILFRLRSFRSFLSTSSMLPISPSESSSTSIKVWPCVGTLRVNPCTSHQFSSLSLLPIESKLKSTCPCAGFPVEFRTNHLRVACAGWRASCDGRGSQTLHRNYGRDPNDRGRLPQFTHRIRPASRTHSRPRGVVVGCQGRLDASARIGSAG
jgi:hypothetical protein